jgi:hypothetical protein
MDHGTSTTAAAMWTPTDDQLTAMIDIDTFLLLGITRTVQRPISEILQDNSKTTIFA